MRIWSLAVDSMRCELSRAEQSIHDNQSEDVGMKRNFATLFLILLHFVAIAKIAFAFLMNAKS